MCVAIFRALMLMRQICCASDGLRCGKRVGIERRCSAVERPAKHQLYLGSDIARLHFRHAFGGDDARYVKINVGAPAKKILCICSVPRIAITAIGAPAFCAILNIPQ